MSSLRAVILALAVSAAAIGCSSTGGTIGGVIPVPKFTKGTLKDGRYTATDKTFSVAVPFPPGTPAYATMEIVERTEAGGESVAFSSSTHPGEVYRVTTFAEVKPSNRLAETTVASFRKQMETTGGAPLRSEKADQALIDGMLAISHRFTQSLSDRTADGARPKGSVAIHTAHFLQRSTRAAFVAVSRVPGGSAEGSDSADARGAAFLKSFRLR